MQFPKWKSPMCYSQLVQNIKNNASEVHDDSDKHYIDYYWYRFFKSRLSLMNFHPHLRQLGIDPVGEGSLLNLFLLHWGQNRQEKSMKSSMYKHSERIHYTHYSNTLCSFHFKQCLRIDLINAWARSRCICIQQ